MMAVAIGAAAIVTSCSSGSENAVAAGPTEDTLPNALTSTTAERTTTTEQLQTATTATPTTTRVPATKTAPAPPPSNCHPSYDPCLAPASDYDCAGGSGNRPAYTGLVPVHGYDEYDLDRDGDGVGCE